jgi:hypothetical protein
LTIVVIVIVTSLPPIPLQASAPHTPPAAGICAVVPAA